MPNSDMNKLEFEQRALSDPWDPELDALAVNVENGEAILAKVRVLDGRLAEVVRVEVPEGLADRILAKVAMEEVTDQESAGQEVVGNEASKTDATAMVTNNVVRGPWLTRVFQQPMAIAASLVVTLAAGLFVGYKLDRVDSPDAVPNAVQVAAAERELSQAIASHVLKENNKLAFREAVNPGLVKATFADFGGQVGDDIGVIVYVSNCPMRDGRRGVHLIAINSVGEPVTIFYMDKEMVSQRETLQVHGYEGEIVPDRRGSWAMISKDKKAGEQVLNRLRGAVKWSI